MSRSSSIEIRFTSPNLSFTELLATLLAHGWHMNDFGRISFLPLSDSDRFEWTQLPYSDLNEAKVCELVGKKESNHELAGVVLQWKDSQSGGEMLFDPRGYMLFSLSVNRRTLADFPDVTDVSWYLSRLAITQIDLQARIESIGWSEYV